MHVLVHVLDAAGIELLGSPAVMPHLMYGCYTNNDFIMPFTQEVKAVYKVFLDASHTVISPDHSDAIDVFALDVVEVIPDLSGTMEGAMDLSGEVDALIDLGGNVFGDILLSGVIDSDISLTGSIETGNELSGILSDGETAGEVRC
jgi:hypothetical protein